jgi:hypothetical protein
VSPGPSTVPGRRARHARRRVRVANGRAVGVVIARARGWRRAAGTERGIAGTGRGIVWARRGALSIPLGAAARAGRAADGVRRARGAGGVLGARRARARHGGRWRGWTLTFRLAGAAGLAGAAALAIAVTGWTPGSIGVLAGAATALAAMVRGPGHSGLGDALAASVKGRGQNGSGDRPHGNDQEPGSQPNR